MNETVRVLIVEDRKDQQKIFKTLINSLQYQSDIAGDLMTAYEKLDRVTYQVALVDLKLVDDDEKNWDGFKVLERFKVLDEGTETLVLTAYGEVEHASEAFRDYKVFDFIRKSKMEITEVADKIHAAADKAQKEMLRMGHRIDDVKLGELFKGEPEALIPRILQTSDQDYLSIFRKSEQLKLFLKGMLSDYAPLLPGKVGLQERKLSNGKPTLQICFWSKALGSPIMLWFGKNDDIKTAIQALDDYPKESQSLGFVTRINKILDSLSFPDFGGAVYTLSNMSFEQFIVLR